MILVKFILLVLILFVFLAKMLSFVYRFQIKEYRFDRLFSYIREVGWHKFLYNSEFRFPAKSPRNIAIVTVLFLISLPVTVLAYSLSAPILLLSLALMPIQTFIMVSMFVFITDIPVYIYRERTIARAARAVAASKAHMIAITGTYGKSSVKELLYTLLSTKYKVGKTDKNMNTDIGVALCILSNLKKNSEFFIAEVGAYRIGEIAKIAKFIKPDTVIVTAFGNQHVDLYGSKEALVLAESEPLQFLSKEGVAYINADIPEFAEITNGAIYRIRTYSIKKKSASIYASGIRADAEGTQATIHLGEHTFEIQTKLLGSHSIQNLLPCILFAHDQGVSISQIRKAITGIEAIPHKLSLHKGLHDSTIISDSINSNVQGFIEAIKVAHLFPHKKKFIATPGIIELGAEKTQSYHQIIDELKHTHITLLTTDPAFADLTVRSQIQVFADNDALLKHIDTHLHKDTLLVLEGRFPQAVISRYMKKG
jgi:UDP-N-acetylmuramoyl-tripeptide--D-alanyl-D-alanine ligase